MKKKETTRVMLGITQQEIAMILKVSRGQWSMCEVGRRNLPTAANLRLNEMLIYMLSPEAKAFQKLCKPDYDDSKTKGVLEKRLKENEFQLLVLTRKIDKVQEKFEKHKKAVRLMGFLNSPAEVEKAAAPEILRSIESRAIRDFRETKSELNLLQIDHELLQLQQEYFQKAVRKLETLFENIPVAAVTGIFSKSSEEIRNALNEALNSNLLSC